MKHIRGAIESECTVLGGLLLESALFPEVNKIINSDDFSTEFHQQIFDCMVDLYKKHKAFDVPMVVDILSFKVSSEELVRIYGMAENCCSTSNIKAHSQIIRETSVKRKLMAAAKEMGKHRTPKEILVSFLREISEEISSYRDVDDAYLTMVMYEINKALVSTIASLDLDNVRK